MTEEIYHITHAGTVPENFGDYIHPSLEMEGFIHCSLRHQIASTLAKHFPDEKNLLVLVIDPSRLTARLIYEHSVVGKNKTSMFPHVYGPINREAITRIEPIHVFLTDLN